MAPIAPTAPLNRPLPLPPSIVQLISRLWTGCVCACLTELVPCAASTHTHTCTHVCVARADTGQDTEERILQLPPLPYQGRRQSLYRSCSSPLLCRHQGVLSSEAEIDSPSSSLRWIHLAPCTMRYAPCTMHHAPCTLHHAPRAS